MKKLLLFMSFLSMTIILNAQELESLLLASDDASKITESYVNPVMKGLMYSMNGGWYTTAKTHKKFGFDITINANASIVPDADQLFDFNQSDYDYLSTENGETLVNLQRIYVMGKTDFSGIRNKGQLPDPQQIKISPEFSDLLDEYVDSAVSMLQELEIAALAYEAGKDREENAAAVRRSLHKLKGEAGIVGIDEIYEFCHEAEFAVEELSDDERGDMLLRVKD